MTFLKVAKVLALAPLLSLAVPTQVVAKPNVFPGEYSPQQKLSPAELERRKILREQRLERREKRRLDRQLRRQGKTN